MIKRRILADEHELNRCTNLVAELQDPWTLETLAQRWHGAQDRRALQRNKTINVGCSIILGCS